MNRFRGLPSTGFRWGRPEQVADKGVDASGDVTSARWLVHNRSKKPVDFSDSEELRHSDDFLRQTCSGQPFGSGIWRESWCLDMVPPHGCRGYHNLWRKGKLRPAKGGAKVGGSGQAMAGSRNGDGMCNAEVDPSQSTIGQAGHDGVGGPADRVVVAEDFRITDEVGVEIGHDQVVGRSLVGLAK